MRTLLTGRGLVESPRWHDGRLWFADWIAGEIIALDGDGRGEVIVRHKSLPLCFDFLPDATPILVSVPANALLAVGPHGALSTYSDLSPLGQFGNDIVIDGRGNAYVNAAGYDPMAGPPPSGPVAPGTVALVTPDGTARIVADDLAFPNGMAVTADNRALIVAESHGHRLSAFQIAADGSLGDRRVWADLGDGAPDGICIDADGAVWYADVPHRHCVRVAPGGAVLTTVELDQGGYACMLGGADGRELFVVTAQWPGMAAVGSDVSWNGTVVSTPVSRPGAGWPARTDGPNP